MSNTFSAGDVALLDQSHRAPATYRARRILCREIRGEAAWCDACNDLKTLVYLIADDVHAHPPGWHSIPTEGRHPSQFIRARAYLTTRLYEWNIT